LDEIISQKPRVDQKDMKDGKFILVIDHQHEIDTLKRKHIEFAKFSVPKTWSNKAQLIAFELIEVQKGLKEAEINFKTTYLELEKVVKKQHKLSVAAFQKKYTSLLVLYEN
jgi:hypothetical protein